MKSERKMIVGCARGWAREVRGGAEPRWGRESRGSGGGGEGDLVAEGSELVDEVAGFAVFVDAVVVVVGAEVDEASGGVGEQVPDDDEDGAGDGDEGLLLAL